METIKQEACGLVLSDMNLPMATYETSGVRIPVSFNAMFVFWNSLSNKLLSKLFYVCLLLEKLVKEKHFPVNEKHFPVKKKFGLVSRKVFSLLAVFVFLQTFLCLFAIRKFGQRKTLSSQRKI